MADGFNALGVSDWVTAPLPNLGVKDWQQAAPTPPPPPTPPPDPVSGGLSGFGKGLGQGLINAVGGTIEGAGAGLRSVSTALKDSSEGEAAFMRQRIGVLDRIDAGETVAPKDDPGGYAAFTPQQRDTLRQGYQAVLDKGAENTPSGQAAGALATAGTGIMGAGAAVTKAGEAALPLTDEEKSRTSVQIAQGLGTIGGYLGAGFVGGLPAIIGTAGMSGLGTHYKQAEAAGATPEEAATAGVLGGLVDGGLMAVPVGQALGIAMKVPAGLRGAFLTGVVDKVKSLATLQGAGEVAKSAATMVTFSQLQTLADNLVTQQTYKPDQAITEHLGEGMGVQAAIGAALPGVGIAMRGAGRLAARGLVGNVEGVTLGGGAEPPAPGAPPGAPPEPGGPAPVAPSQRVLGAPSIDGAIDAAFNETQATSPGAPPADSKPPPAPPPIRESAPLSGTVEQTENGYQFRQTDPSGTETVHNLDVWNPDAPVAPATPGATTIAPDTAIAIRDHYAAAGVRTVFYQGDTGVPFDGGVDPAHPDTLFLSNNPTRNIAQVAGHEFTHVLASTTLPDGTSLGDLLNQQIAAGITPAGQRYAERTFGATAPERGSFPAGDQGAADHVAAVQAHLINELGTDIGGEAPKFQSFIPRVMDAIQARFGDGVAADMLRKMMDGLRTAMDTIRGLFGETGTRSQNWVTNLGEVHDTLAQMYAERFGTPVAREQARLAAVRDKAERDQFVAEAAPPAETAAPAPPEKAEQASPSTTGLADLGDAAKAMGENFRTAAWAKVQAGDTTEAGGPSNLLTLAKSARDAGGLQTEAQFRAFIEAVAPHLGDRTEGWQGRLLEAGRPFARPSGVPAEAPAPQVPAPASTQLAAAPGFHEIATATQARALQLRRWLDGLAADRAAAAAAHPKVKVLEQTEAAILRPVGGDAAALTEAGKTRLEQVRTQIDEAKHPEVDTPAMATVRGALAATPAGQVAATTKAAIRGPVGDFGDYSRFTPDARLFSDSGRALAPVPKFGDPDASNRAFSGARKKIDRWLINEARAEATAKGNAHLADILARHTVDNFSMSDRDTAMDVVFGNDRGPEARHMAAPAVENSVEKPVSPAEHPGLVVQSLVTGKRTTIQPPGTVAPASPVSGEWQKAWEASRPPVKAPAPAAPANPVANPVSVPPAPTDAVQGEAWWKAMTPDQRKLAIEMSGMSIKPDAAWQYLTVTQRARLLADNRALPAKPEAATSLRPEATPPPKNTVPAAAEQAVKIKSLTREINKDREFLAGVKEGLPNDPAIPKLEAALARKEARLAALQAPAEAAAGGAAPPPPPEAPRPASTAEPEPPPRPEAAPEPEATAPPEDTVPPEPERPAGYGADNKTFTAEMAAKARARLREKMGRLNSGFDPEMAFDGLMLAGFHVEAGARKFAAYAKEMLADLGANARPHLAQWYTAVRMQHGFDARGMDDAAHVDAELNRMAEASTKAPEVHDGSGDRDGGLDQPGSGGAEQAGDLRGQPAGERPVGDVAASAPGDVPQGGGPPAETGVRAGPEVPGRPEPVHQGGDAAGGRGVGGDPGVVAPGAGGTREPVPASVRPNFHIADPEQLIGGTPKVRFARNREAVEALHAIEEEQRDPTPAELQSLAGYIGWGSFGQDLFQGTFEHQPPRSGWDAEGKWLRDHLGKDAWESAQRSIINAHYTDPPTVKAMWDMVDRMGFKGGRVLEPSMGIGNFFGMMPRDMMAASSLTGIELDRLSASMAKLLYPVAGIHQKGYQDSKTPDGFYDLVIGNWPFAAQSPADRRYDRLSPTLHDYFFLKALDQTRPGGLVVGITSAGTMDKSGRSARIEMAKKGELLGAFRLPAGAFEKYAGTHVVTDILVLRKRTEPVTDVLAEPWINATEMREPGGNMIRVNQYFQDHPDKVLGTFGFGRSTVGRQAMTVHRPADFADRLNSLPAFLPKDGFAPVPRGSEPRFVSNNTTDRQGSVTIGEDGKLYQVQGERMAMLEDVAKMGAGTQKAQKALVNQVENLVSMRRSYGALLDAEREGRPETEDIRLSLAKQYEAFTAKHGALSGSPGLLLLKRVKDPAHAALEALTRPDGTPSRILSEPTVRSRRSIDNPSVADAYVLARNEKAAVDIDRVATLAKKPRDAVEQELLTSGAIMRVPGAGFEPKDVYLSGNVRRKLREAQDAAANGEDMQASIDALTNVLPPTVPYHQIEAKLGAPWAGSATYKAFLGDVLGLPADRLDDVHVRFAGSRWRVGFANASMNRTPEALQAGSVFYRFDKLVAAAMGNNVVKIMGKDENNKPVLDHAATEEVNAKAQALRERFQDWAWADAERKVQLEGAYNEAMNAVARPRYDGSFMDLSGMALRRGTDPFSLRKHQMDAIWRGVVTGRGLFAHEVGTGKSYTMAGIAVEGRRYGVFRKPLVLAHNANSAAVAREFQDMYPGGKFLYIDNMAPGVIETNLHRIANEDWDAVVMPHSLIDRMTLSRETLTELATDQITDLENEAIEAAREDGINLTPAMMDDPEAMKKVRNITAKQLVKQREAIYANIDKQANRASSENAVAFEKLGIDAVIVDEAHEFKKPPIATRMALKGLNTATSDRSIALDFLTGYVNKLGNGRGTFLFTGTPVTNALNEVFNMARYFMRDRMEADGVKDWDAWFNTFADGVSDVELTSTGGYEPVKRLSAFVNVDELIRSMSEFTDVVQAKDMPEFVPRTTPDGKSMTSPDLTPEGRDFLQNGRTENPVGRPYKKILTDVAQMPPAQQAILADLQARARVFKAAKGAAKKQMLDEGEGLKVENGLRAASIDARMYDPSAPDDPTSKASRVAVRVLEHYQEERAAQAIFVDQGYNPNKTSEGRADRFVLVQDVLTKLVAGGIPRKEIKIVSGKMSAETKKATADAMNAGTVRVVIGLSSTLGVGVNMQTNLRAMHHMDAPWRPGDLEQRNGRGERQGNEWNTVLEYRYITEGIDGRNWQVLTTKDRFIKQFISAFNDSSGKRLGNIEGDGADISETPDILETLGEAAGDPRIMLRAKFSADINRMERRERMHTLGQADAKQRARAMRQAFAAQNVANERDAVRLKAWESGQARAEEAKKAAVAALDALHAEARQADPKSAIATELEAQRQAARTRTFYDAEIGGKTLHMQADIQPALDDLVAALKPGDDKTLAFINGHELHVRYPVGRQPTYTIAGSHIEAPTIARVNGAVTALRNRVAFAAKPGNFEESVLRLEAAGDEPFPRQADLLKKRQQLANLVDDLQANPVPAPAWLRHGAPLDSTIYVDGQPRIVRGHRMTDDYKLVTDEGEVSYRRARDENGNQIYEVHAPPVQPEAKADSAPVAQDGAPDGAQFSPKITGTQRESEPYTPEQMKAYANVGRITDAPTWRERLAEARKDLGRRTIAAVLDPYIGVKADDPAGYMALRNANTSSGALLQFMSDGTLKFDGSTYAMDDRNGGVEHHLIRPLQGEENRFIWWVAANRAERLSAEDRENLWSANDIDAIKSTNQGTVPFDYELSGGGTTRSREAIYLDSLKKLDVFNRNALDLAVQSGLISDDAASVFAANPFYVPFYRDHENEGRGRFTGGSVSAGFVKQYAFKSLKGGAEKLNHDLWANAIGNWSHMIDASLRNRAAAGVLDVAMTNGAAEEVTQRQAGYMKQSEKDKLVWVMNNGRQQHFAITDPMLYTAITALDFSGYRNPIMQAATKFKTMLTMGVTADPRFMLRVFIKDAEQAVAVAPLSANLVGNIVQGLKMSNFNGALANIARTIAGQEAHRLRLSDEAANAIAGGATMHLGSGHDTGQRKVNVDTMLDNSATTSGFLTRLGKIARATKELSAVAEDVQRLAIYHKLIAEGVPHDQAAFAGRDMEDFTLKGGMGFVRAATQLVPFLNAMMQGLYKVGRAASSADRNIGVAVGKRFAYAATVRIAAVLGTTALLSLFQDWFYADDEDYKKRTDDDRNSHFWFKIGGTVFRIPMGFEIAAGARIAANGVEAFFGTSEMTGRRFLNNVASILVDNLYMNPTPQALKPILEVAMNRNSQGGAIVSESQSKLQSQDAFTPQSTLAARGASALGSSAARGIGGANAKFLTPTQIDHLVEGYFGWLGAMTLTVADNAFRAADQGQAALRGAKPAEPVRADKDLWAYFSGGMIESETTAASRYLNMLYEQKAGIDEAFATYHGMLDRRESVQAREFYAANKDLLAKHEMVGTLGRTEAAYGKDMRRIESSLTLTAEQKHDQLMKYQALRNKAAENIFGPRHATQ